MFDSANDSLEVLRKLDPRWTDSYTSIADEAARFAVGIEA
jgi:hypothetical protein